MTPRPPSLPPDPSPRDWVARTVPLPDLPDLVRVAGHSGLLWRHEHGGIAASGEAFRLEFPEGLADRAAVSCAVDVLAAVITEDDVGLPGCGPVAIGAMPFDPAAPGCLVVPRRIVGRRADQAWLTTIEPAAAVPAGGAAPVVTEADPPPRPAAPPDEFTLTPSMPHAEWKALVAATVERIDASEFEKVVLARRIDIAANRPFVITDVPRPAGGPVPVLHGVLHSRLHRRQS